MNIDYHIELDGHHYSVPHVLVRETVEVSYTARVVEIVAETCSRSWRIATVLASQLLVDQWHDQIGDPAVADAICDRLLDNAHRIELRGEFRRKRKSSDG